MTEPQAVIIRPDVDALLRQAPLTRWVQPGWVARLRRSSVTLHADGSVEVVSDYRDREPTHLAAPVHVLVNRWAGGRGDLPIYFPYLVGSDGWVPLQGVPRSRRLSPLWDLSAFPVEQVSLSRREMRRAYGIDQKGRFRQVFLSRSR